MSRDAAHFAIVRSESDAHGQGIHADATRKGFTILRAMERAQYLVVVLHGFHAMRILDELREYRTAATNLLRETLNVQASPRTFSDKEWRRVEPEAWEFLVHKEFEARGLPHFEAVRVPIQRGGSLVLDTRCLHGGAPGDGSPGLRAHAYGLVYDDDTEPDSAAAALEKDYLTTVDILDRDGDYAPVGTWGSRNNLWGSTAAAAFGSL
jgi:hypothetical protein